MTTTTERRDVYATITNRIIAELERGVRPWIKPWNSGNASGRITRPLRQNGTPYRGINILVLWIETIARGYTSPLWMTFNQAAELGAHVRRGEHGTLIVYADRFRKTETNESGDAIEREIPFLKGYTVFNTMQIEGLPDHYYPTDTSHERQPGIAAAEEFFAATGAQIRLHPSRAAYVPSHDCILMPPREAFISLEGYYDTLGHEHVHWTAHETRLARELKGRFGSEAYAAEELIAELGAAFLCSDLGISADVRPDHAEYLATWLKVLRDDKRAIFTAAAHAQRAADYLHSLQEEERAA